MINNIPPVTRAIAITIAVGFLAQMIAGPWLTQFFALWPLSNGFMPWQLLTHGLLHMSFLHLFFTNPIHERPLFNVAHICSNAAAGISGCLTILCGCPRSSLSE